MINYELLKKLCTSNGVSGDEESIRAIIFHEIKNYCDDIKIDNLGNLIAFKKGKSSNKNKLMICAHMDEVGFIVTNITEDGYLKFETVGGIDKKVIPGKCVNVGKNNLPGVIGVKPIHLIESQMRQNIIDIKDMYVDIGAESKKEALKYVNLGDSINFTSIFEVKNELIKAKALDDRAGCFILINLIKKDLPYDVYFTFVTQEEVGLRGSTVAAYSVETESAIVVDSTTAADIPYNKDENSVCKVNEGAVISFMDKATIYNKEYYDLAFKVAKKNNIKVQPKTAVAGGNDAGAIHKSRKGVKTLAVSLPCRYLHSQTSLVSTFDLLNVENLIEKLIAEI